MPFERRRTVYLGDDDLSGLIFFASYFRYMSEGDQDYMEALGHPVAEHAGSGTTCPAVHAECDFVAPTGAGDSILQHIRIVPGGRTSFTCEHEFTNQEGTVVGRGRIVRVWVDMSTMKPQPLPEWVLEAGRADAT
ncbi:MAG TPA: thioesterase family protein [Acidimicrobiales bacterium]|nr:thioesterase family protein [Acidimicrobiales bacterium]